MAAKTSCLNCGNKFIGRSNASYCSPACRLRAHRARSGSGETVSAPRRRRSTTAGPKIVVGAGGGGHSVEAVALLAELNSEAVENAVERGELPPADGQGDWTAAERAVLEMIACAVDRKVDLSQQYADTDDAKLRIKLSGELRLLQAHIAQLLKQVKTDLPAPPSRTTQKASQAARTRWRGRRNGQGTA